MNSDILLYIGAGTVDEELYFDNRYLPELLSERLLKEISGAVYYSIPETYTGKLVGAKDCFVRKGGDDVDFWKDIFSRSGSDHLCRINADSPFLDPSIIREMIDLHLNYLAEFTFSENLPAGLSCEVISKELISSIPDSAEKTLPLGQVVKSNINHFDIELFYKDPDIRDKRISFLSSSKRDRKIMENIVKKNGSVPPYTEIRNIIENSPDVLYTGPSYLEIELTGECELECLFCYRTTLKQTHGAMEPAIFARIIEQMKSFNLPYTICFGGSGEPLMHPSFYEIIKLAAGDPLVQNIIIESNGLHVDANYRNFLIESGRKITTIININGKDAETYTRLHGRDFFERVKTNVLALKESAGDRLYIQIMKINETEPYLDAYYDFWEKQSLPIILQKQNTFLGRITDRRYSDLSPLDRIPCWHLQRDLYVTADGSVSFCKQDVDGQHSSGNIRTDTIPNIWEIKKSAFINEYKKNYPAQPDCKLCDEWYTFNS